MNHKPNAIAVVGMACRFPKGLEDLHTLWNALRNKFSAIHDVPADRWTQQRYYSSNPVAKGKAYMHRGGFLTHPVQMFDPGFFGISPRDAENMDPQQRILLEVVWEAFENSGISLPEQAGKAVGVYVGGFMLDHMISQMASSNRSQINQYTAAGMMMTMLSNRISHTFDLRGPSLSIDTACSSSLVAFHYACLDLWRGATEMAVVGGANVMLRPEYPMGMCKGHFLSRDGECKSFDERGDGYGRGEGAGIVVLKPLAAALAHRDPILAIVEGTGSNQDGRTPGISMPSKEAQETLIRQVCAEHRIDPREIRYVECHGTGTAIGDPTESAAIGAVYGAARKEIGPVIVGSIKSNIGHLEAAAGVAGVIKAVLTLMHRQSTPLANLQQPNSAIPLDKLNLRLSNELILLGNPEESFCVAINSFGYGGSNAHVVLRTPLAQNPIASNAKKSAKVDKASRPFPHFLPVSARSSKAMYEMAGRLASSLQHHDQFQDVLYTMSMRRAHLAERAVVMGNDRDELIAGLRSLQSGTESTNVVLGSQPFQGCRKPVFVFTGMGPQWWGMGQELYRQDTIYRNAVDEADRVFQTISGFSILQEMLRDESESQITRTEYAQPANLMVQIGILAMLKAAGVEPGAVVGHSVGELGSAYAAGALTLHDALTVSFHRSRLQATCAGTGGMLAVGLSKENALIRIAPYANKVSVAAVNGPNNVTLAGDVDALADIANELLAENIFHRKLDVEVPYHSPMMDPIMQPLSEALAQVQPSMPKVPLYSTVTGKRVEEISYGAAYWPLNIRQSVEFADAIQEILAAGFNTFLEIGPQPVLSTSLKECIKVAGKECRTLYTLRKSTPELANIHRAIMGVFACGCDIDWSVHNGVGSLVSLPNYPWQRERFWLENDRAMQDRVAPIDYPMLGIQEAPGSPVYRNDFDHEPLLYLRDHVVSGMPVLPAAGYIEVLFELANLQFPDAAGLVVRDLEIMAPMLITAERGLDCVTSYDPHSRRATIRGLENGKLGSGQVHVAGQLVGLKKQLSHSKDLSALHREFEKFQDVTAFYASLQQIGLNYGPAFQTIRELRLNADGDGVLAHISMPANLQNDLSLYHVHPTVLDACFQSLIKMLGGGDKMYLPTSFGEVCLHVRHLPASAWCLGEKTFEDERHINCNLTLINDAGEVLLSIRGMRSTAAASRERTDRFGDKVKRQILNYEWSYAGELSEPKRLGHWLIVGDHENLSHELTRRLEDFGATVVGRVQFGERFDQFGADYIVRSGHSQDFKQVIDSCGDIDGVLLLHGMTSGDSQDPVGQNALSEITTFLQALLQRSSPVSPRLYFVTQSAFDPTGSNEEIRPDQTAMNGFARVAFNELPGLRSSTIDVPTHITDDVLYSLTLELLCDDGHDEVALRGNMRLTSELLESHVLTNDEVEYCHLDDDHPILVRPLRSDVESVGTARVVSTQVAKPGPDEIKLRIVASMVPSNLLMDQSSDAILQPLVEVVADVIEVGKNVIDLQANDRVCGFVPADLASHMVVHRSRSHLVALSPSADAVATVGTFGLHARAERAVGNWDQSLGDTALVQVQPLGLAIGKALERRGVVVTYVSEHSDASLDVGGSLDQVYSLCPVGLEQAVRERTDGQGFAMLIAGLHDWVRHHDFRMCKPGAAVIDLDADPKQVLVAPHIQSVVRTDLHSLSHRTPNFEASLTRALDLIESKQVNIVPTLDVSIYDLAWQKLPLADTQTTLVLTYETANKDLPTVKSHHLQFKQNATYMITGGLGGLGQKTAEWLVKNGANSLVLTGRTGANTPTKRAFVESLQSMGASVLVAECDTADYASLAKLFERMEKDLPPLCGIFHSGAVILDQPVAEIDDATLSQVMQSKALGAWNLHQLTSSLELDYFVVYSSVANLVGNSRQSIYSAANGFLNGLAALRRSRGLAGTSVAWGAIADVGVVAQDDKLEQFLRYTGLRGIPSEEALSVLQEALARNVVHFGVTLITSWADWARFETQGATSPRFATLIASDTVSKDNSFRDALVAELAGLAPGDQVELVSSLIAEIIAAVLKSDVGSVPIDRTINQLGVDSLMATEIQMLLDSKLGINVSILELIGDSTIRTLAVQAQRSLISNTELVPA